MIKFALAVCIALAACSPAFAQRTPTTVQNVVAQEHASGRFNGAVVVLKGGNPIYSEGFGLAGPPGAQIWSARTLTRYASVTKQVTALLVLQEVAAGRLALDTLVSSVLPKTPEALRGVTIEQLLRHTSGTSETEEPGVASTDFPFRPADLSHSRANPLVMAQANCSGPPFAPPGTRFSYGDCEYFWLGAVLEHTTRKPFAALVRDRISRRLALRSWGLYRPGRRDRTAVGFVAPNSVEPQQALWAYSSGAGLYGTLDDLARFERALVRSELLPQNWTDRMFDGKPEYQSHAMGSWVYTAPSPAGETTRFIERQGWVGGIRLSLVAVPERDLVVAMVSNAPDSNFDGPWNPDGFVGRVVFAALNAP